MDERERWRLKAPKDFNWTDSDVIFEKNDSLLTGLIIGLIIGALIVLVLVA